MCKLCNVKTGRRSKLSDFNTSDLSENLNTNHVTEFSAENKRKQTRKENVAAWSVYTSNWKRKKLSDNASKQPTIEDVFQLRNICDTNDSKDKRVHMYIGEMIAMDIQPFSIVENIYFARLMNQICPNY